MRLGRSNSYEDTSDQDEPLSAREREVAGYLGEDDTYAQIAVQLGVSHETIRVHARNILRKLGVRTRHAAVAQLALRSFPVTRMRN